MRQESRATDQGFIRRSLFWSLCCWEDKGTKVGNIVRGFRFVPVTKTVDSLKTVLVRFFEGESGGATRMAALTGCSRSKTIDRFQELLAQRMASVSLPQIREASRTDPSRRSWHLIFVGNGLSQFQPPKPF